MIPILGPGCAGGTGTLTAIPGLSSQAPLEWDDLDAAVSYVVARHGLSLVEAQTGLVVGEDGAEHAVRLFRLVDVRDRPVEIRFSTDPGALAGLRGASVSRPGALVVRVGRFGDDQLEQTLLAELLDRLGRLEAID